MNNQPKPKSGAPLIIIGAVALIVILVAFFYLQSSKTPTATNANRTTANTPRVSAIPSNAPVGAQPPNMKGGQNATVTIEEFADFQCPTCASVYTVMNQVHAAYGSRIKFIFRNFPLQMHRNGYDASVAAEAAYLQDQNKFWEMQNQLFTNQTAWANQADPRATFRGYAEKIGLDVVRWENDVIGLAAKTRVNLDMERGRALNITGTPTVYINGQPHTVFTLEALRQAIDAELAKAPAQNSAPAPAQPAKPANANSK